VTDKRAKDAWANANHDPITLHEARHTFASLLIDSGANAKAVQEFMGHSKIQTTFENLRASAPRLAG
jgi:integrase/recombinase XerC